ncbi:MAG: cobalt ECF transporter T component CbiQ [Candidatus Ranarchaeia archaeon]
MSIHDPFLHVSTDLHMIESYAQQDSIFHRWDPRLKLLFVFALLALVTQIRYFTSGAIVLVTVLIFVKSAGLSLRFMTMRILNVILLTTLLACIALFLTVPGEPLISLSIPMLPVVSISYNGVNNGGLLFLRVTVSLFLLSFLIFTTPSNIIFNTLQRFHVPRIFVSTLMLTYRYIILLAEETRRLIIAYLSRSPQKKKFRERLYSISVILSQTFLRSLDRGERIFNAMVSRGFQGSIPTIIDLRYKRTDILITLSLLLITGLWFLQDLSAYHVLFNLFQASLPITLVDWLSVLHHFLSSPWG